MCDLCKTVMMTSRVELKTLRETNAQKHREPKQPKRYYGLSWGDSDNFPTLPRGPISKSPRGY